MKVECNESIGGGILLFGTNMSIVTPYYSNEGIVALQRSILKKVTNGDPTYSVSISPGTIDTLRALMATIIDDILEMASKMTRESYIHKKQPIPDVIVVKPGTIRLAASKWAHGNSGSIPFKEHEILR